MADDVLISSDETLANHKEEEEDGSIYPPELDPALYKEKIVCITTGFVVLPSF